MFEKNTFVGCPPPAAGVPSARAGLWAAWLRRAESAEPHEITVILVFDQDKGTGP
jgi:hypothetical protein